MFSCDLHDGGSSVLPDGGSNLPSQRWADLFSFAMADGGSSLQSKTVAIFNIRRWRILSRLTEANLASSSLFERGSSSSFIRTVDEFWGSSLHLHAHLATVLCSIWNKDLDHSIVDELSQENKRKRRIWFDL